ncbi:MAG: AMP-binding protein [Gammaproteobacteria bacterium]|nr:AMP-binding protein [Gammaproteobacteria bacterium]
MYDYPNLNAALVTQAKTDKWITYIEGKQEQRRFSYAQLSDRASMLLFDLQEAGLQPGDQLIILHKDNQTFVEAFWACVCGGIVPVPIAVGISDEHRAKLFRVFTKLERPYLYTTQDNLDRLNQFAEQYGLNESMQGIRSKTLLSNLMEEHDERGVHHTPQLDDVCFIQFSSGSTSEPKGVVLTHRNVLVNLHAIAEGAGYTPDDISLSWMPLTHDMGLLGFHLNMIAVGMSQCLMPTDLFSRRPLLWMEKVSELKATVTCSPNFGYKHFLKALGSKTLEDVDLAHVRVIYNGAEPISIELCQQFIDALAPYSLPATAMFTVYGLAEATLAVAFPVQGVMYRAVYVDRHAMRLGDVVKPVSASHPDAVGFAIEGKPVLDMLVKITDENNKSLPPTHIGLVQIKGPSVTAGYYLDEDANSNALTGDGWLNTGDLGFLNNEGELVITGREKDIIFSNGQNYYPHDIETVALQLQELELGKVVAYGLRQPNAQSDELLIFILYRADISGFIGIARDVMRHINEQTGLEVAHVIPVNRIPKTTSGKLQRRLLGDTYLKGEYDEVIAEIQSQINAAHTQDTGDLSQTEYRIKTIFAEAVKDKAVAVQDNFFETGISSLTLTEIHQQIDEVWPGVVDVTDMFEHQTIAELAAFIDAKLAE